jgi:hypothetical protein
VSDAVLEILCGALLTLITAWSLGKILLRSLRVRLCRLEEDLFAFLTGSACLSAAVFVLASLHLVGRGAFTILCVASIGFLYWRDWLRLARERLPRTPRMWLCLFAVPFTAYTFLYFFNALAPQANASATAYHLGNVMRWWADRGFDRYAGSAFANLPQGLEMLFLFAFPFGKHSAAVLVHFAFLLALPWLMLCYGRRFGMVRPLILGAMLVYLSPAAGVLGTTASNDVAMACVLFGLFYLLELWDASGDNRWLGLAGLLAGFGYAINYVAALGVIASIAFVGWRLLRQRKPVARALVILLSSAAISIAPWIVKNWLWVGNPFSPFFNSWFPNSNIHVWSEKSYAASLGLSSIVNSPQDLSLLWSLQGTSVQGIFGPWLLLTPLAFLAVRWKHGRRLLLAGALFGLLAVTDKAFALVLPFAVFAAPALGLAVQNSPGVLPLLLLLHSLVSWPGVVERFADPHAWRIKNIPVAEALRSVPEDQQLLTSLDGYAVARTTEQVVPEHARILTLWPVPQAYTKRQLWDRSESAAGELAFQSILAVHESLVHPLLEIRFRFSQQPLRALRVVATDKANELWSVNEMRVYLAGVEISRRSSWRVSARPNSAEAPLAFDNSEVTAWSPWQATQPGMYLEEDFDGAIPIDQALALGARGQLGTKLRVDGLGNDGQWRMLAAAPEISIHLAPPGLRGAAARELKSLGFDYVVARHDQAPALDMLRYPSYWGITCFKEVGNVCIFRLD